MIPATTSAITGGSFIQRVSFTLKKEHWDHYKYGKHQHTFYKLK